LRKREFHIRPVTISHSEPPPVARRPPAIVAFPTDRSYFFDMSKGTDTRARIVETALRSASIDGVEGISLGKVAADVGMSKSGLFAHFDSKEALQVDVIARAADKFVENVITPALKFPRAEPRLRALFENWLEWEQNESLPGGCVFMHATAELDDRPGPVRDALVSHQQEWLKALGQAVQLTIDEGHFKRDVDPPLFAFQVYGIVLSYYHSARLVRDPAAKSNAMRSFDSLMSAAARPS
jgi:AcrR family transcriptional regulator